MSSPSDTAAARADLIARYTDDHHVYETFSQHRAAPGFIGLRLDGNGFSKLTKDLVKPFDERFERAIEAGCETLARKVPGVICVYVQSDEVTMILRPDCDWFDRRVEKLLTICSSMISVAFCHELTAQLGEPVFAQFDARLLELPTEQDAAACLAERQMDSIKNAVSSLVYWTLRQQEGLSKGKATRKLAPMGMHDRMTLCEELGVPFNSLSPARRRGRILTFVTRPHEGFNPITQEKVMTTRRVLEWDYDMADLRFVDRLPGLERD